MRSSYCIEKIPTLSTCTNQLTFFFKSVFLKISKIRKMSCSVSLNEVMILQPTCISIAITVQWTILEILEFVRTPTPTELIVPLFCLFLHKKGIKAWYLASNFTTDIETLVEQWMYPSAAIHTLLFVKKKIQIKLWPCRLSVC